MTTSVIPQKGLPKDYLVNIKIPLYHRSGEKPLDPTTLLSAVGELKHILKPMKV